MSETFRLIISLALGLSWCLWVFILWWRKRPNVAIKNGQPVIVYASQTGQARAAAQSQLAILADAILLPLNRLTPQHFVAASELHFYVSTYGDGEAPDNGRGFIKTLNKINNDTLKAVKFSVTAFGDSRYPAFCAFGKKVYHQLTQFGAQPLAPMQCIDDNDPTRSRDEIETFSTATLQECLHLNPNSNSPGLYQLSLKVASLAWQPGDLLEVVVPELQGYCVPRSYSIASAASDKLGTNVIKLLVRLHIKPDGQQGLVSGYLTQQCRIGTEIKVKVRANPACQLRSESTPLILIGAGSGLAGLLGHIEQRALVADAGPVWLVYGEREPTQDQHLASELSSWQQQNVLTRIDRTYSRQQQEARYVQEVLLAQAQLVKQFIAEQGDIYVCGSLAGMGKAVHQALIEILGEDELDELAIAGRYHRDLY
ncbi:NADPH cytochrome P450 oxidoreductase family protein [Thalassotalea agariperforans]